LAAVSNSVKDTIVYLTGQPEKVRIIPIGVDGSIFTTSKDNDKADKNQILYVGFINFNKGIDVLLKAFHYIHKKKPNVKLVIVGGSFFNNTMKQEKQLRNITEKLELINHIEFAGIKSPSEVAKYMRESALLVLPSRAESFGAVLVEALACGTPIVATKCGGPEDIVTDKVGILVQKENDEALAKAIETILDHQNTYGKTILRDYAISKFSWEGVAGRTIDLYEETLKNEV
jgi:glycosyltransferase involved in cell wall biosynthesis